MAWILLESRGLVRRAPESVGASLAAMKGRVLGLDLGERRIGLAISDEEGQFAFPAGYHERSRLARDLEALRVLAAEQGVVRIVVGLPLLLDGREGTGARAAREFATALGAATSLPVELVDERLTTKEAEHALREAPSKTRRGRKHVIDSMAATLLLRGWLESRARSEAGR